MPLGAGRKVDPVWNAVTKVDDSSKVSCNYCGIDVSSKVERINAHFDKCVAKIMILTGRLVVVDTESMTLTNDN